VAIIEHPSGNTTVTKYYRCTVCGFRGKDSYTYLATESGFHRPIVYFTYAPWWCQEHGEEAMFRLADPDDPMAR